MWTCHGRAGELSSNTPSEIPVESRHIVIYTTTKTMLFLRLACYHYDLLNTHGGIEIISEVTGVERCPEEKKGRDIFGRGGGGFKPYLQERP